MDHIRLFVIITSLIKPRRCNVRSSFTHAHSSHVNETFTATQTHTDVATCGYDTVTARFSRKCSNSTRI